MNIKTIKEKLGDALETLKEKDSYLLENKINEPAISHRLAVHLTPLFPGFHVDCENNGNIDANSGRKYVYILREKATELGLELNDLDENGFVDRKVYPDIIVHRRGENGQENNILVVEIKKTSSRISHDFDHEKLKRFTSSKYGNAFNYFMGAFVLLNVEDIDYSVDWFRNGNIFD